jgi:hypothetical protein
MNLKNVCFVFLIAAGTCPAMDWPVQDSVMTRNFGWNDRGKPALGSVFEGEEPVLAADAGPASFIPHTESAVYYFGNIDNQRIAFSHGEVNLSPMDPRGRTAVHDHSYALQNLWEEAAGAINSYSSLWSDIQVTGVYVH